MIDLSMFMSGPMTSLIFADGGAEVIKVESVQRIDGWRAGGATEDFLVGVGAAVQLGESEQARDHAEPDRPARI